MQLTITVIFVAGLSIQSQALECGLARREHLQAVQRTMQYCLAQKLADDLGNNFSLQGSMESQSDETDVINSQPNVGRMAQIRLRNPNISNNSSSTSGRTTSQTAQTTQETTTNTSEVTGITQDAVQEGTVSYNITILSSNETNNDSITPITIQITNTSQSSNQDQGVDYSSTTQESREANTSTNCIISCLLHQMQLMNSTGFPDQLKIANGLLQGANRTEVRNFFQESTSDCFQQLEGRNLDRCEFSTHLVTCLADKGRSNCTDWPDGNLPYQA